MWRSCEAPARGPGDGLPGRRARRARMSGMAELSPGTQLAGCRIDAVVGRGGMGLVYRAVDLRLGRPVAMKLITAERATDPEFRARFEREARLTASIDHPNVIPIYGAGEEDGHLYLVMRYDDGTDLQALLSES